jgi:hypothetical protein
MVLALAVVSAAFFALPAMASAQEVHLEGGETFNISGLGYEGRTEGEPAFACASTGGSGKFDVGSTTTGAVTLDLTGCYTILFGMKFNCTSEGSAFSGTIATGGTFHLITVSSAAPGLLLTTNKTVVTSSQSTLLNVAKAAKV